MFTVEVIIDTISKTELLKRDRGNLNTLVQRTRHGISYYTLVNKLAYNECITVFSACFIVI